MRSRTACESSKRTYTTSGNSHITSGLRTRAQLSIGKIEESLSDFTVG